MYLLLQTLDLGFEVFLFLGVVLAHHGEAFIVQLNCDIVLVNADEKTVKLSNSLLTYFDNDLKRKMQIDLTHDHKGTMPHTHVGYDHDEGGTKHLSTEEKAMVDFVRKTWQDKNNK